MARKFKNYLQNEKLRASNTAVDYTPEMLDEIVKCTVDPFYFIEKYIKIIHVDHGLINIKLYDFQKKMIQSFIDNRYTIAMFTRQSGKSVAYVCYLLHTILFSADKNIGIFANKFSNAKDMLHKVKLAYEELPLWLQQGVKSWNKNSIELENNSRISAFSTSSSAGRSGSFSIIVLDEYAFVPKNVADEFMASVYPTISSGTTTKCIMVSTPNGMNHFYKFWKDSLDGKNLYVAITAPWNCRPERDLAWLEEQRKQLGEQRFNAEVLCKFLGSANILIDAHKLECMTWDEPIQDSVISDLYYYDSGVVANGTNEFLRDSKYVVSVDTSHGNNLDNHAFTVIEILENKKYKVVAKFKNNNISPVEYTRIVYNTAKKYNNAHVLIEINDMGYLVADTLYTDFEYENMYCTTKSNTSKRNSQQISLYYTNETKLGVKTSRSTKSIGCSTLKTLIENDVLEIKDYDTISELAHFVRVADSYSAEEGYHDDLTMSLVNFAWLTTQASFQEDIVLSSESYSITDNKKLISPFTLIDGINNVDKSKEDLEFMGRMLFSKKS